MSRNDKILNIIEFTLEVGPDLVQGIIDLCRSGNVTPESIRNMKEASKDPYEILAEHGITFEKK
ncbi:MAG: hypothetical protein ACERJ1_17910 [Halodesulfovibrio sp.]|uniref:hypothetical protein n=1 Tax=Halodesulfovibrio sp. TaxID=1912772 RepID=UPI00359EF0B9